MAKSTQNCYFLRYEVIRFNEQFVSDRSPVPDQILAPLPYALILYGAFPHCVFFNQAEKTGAGFGFYCPVLAHFSIEL